MHGRLFPVGCTKPELRLPQTMNPIFMNPGLLDEGSSTLIEVERESSGSLDTVVEVDMQKCRRHSLDLLPQ